MNELKTISDSKKEFHLSFPFVIAPIYRRVTDELLVELHLLKHQKGFKTNDVFAVGLIKVFNDFMQGYKPEEHVTQLFDALCKCNAIDSNEIRKQSNKTLEEVNKFSLEALEGYLNEKGEKGDSTLSNHLKSFKENTNNYSRLSIIGLYTILNSTKDNQNINNEELSRKTQEISDKIGFSSSRVEKDLGLYKTNLDKIVQALELLNESIEREKRKLKDK